MPPDATSNVPRLIVVAGADPPALLLGFGVEKHDDAVDALVYLILGLVGDGLEEQKVHYI
jgi:hypothetical protein